MSKRKKILSFCKKLGKKLALALLIFHGATEIDYLRNDNLNTLYPSPIRRDFNERFGFPLKGWSNDIEENPGLMTKLSNALYFEKKSSEFDLINLRLESGNYLNSDIREQFGALFTVGYSGWCFLERIGLSTNKGFETAKVHHEIKQLKANKLVKEHPEFLKRWEELSKDKDGKSLYRGYLETYARQLNLVNKCFDKNANPLECLELGFITDYARSTPIEDMADLCSAESFPDYLESVLENEKIIKKLKLAEEYGLVSRGFLEYSNFRVQNRNAIYFCKIENKTRAAKELVSKIKDFLDKNSKSLYECELRKINGNLLYEIGIIESSQKEEKSKCLEESVKDSILEYKKGLNSEFKERDSYVSILKDIIRCYESLNDSRNSQIYSKALLEYQIREQSGDISLPNRGVNDFILMNTSQLVVGMKAKE